AQPMQLLDLPTPEPRDGEVLLRVRCCGVCYSDLKTATGHMPYSASLKLPHVAGHEIVAETVPDAQRVVVYNYWPCGRCRSCRGGRDTVCSDLLGWVGFTSPGGFQEYLCVPEQYVLPVPDSIPDEQAAAISCATGTSYRAIVTRGDVRPGEVVLIVGVG